VKPPVVIGVVVAVVILAAGMLAPMFRDAAAKKADAAREEAALAQRELHRYSARMGLVAQQVGAKELAPDAVKAAAEAAAEQLRDTNSRYNQLVQQARTLATEHGMPEPVVPPLGAAQQALAAFQQSANENAALLKEAITYARQAVGDAPEELGVSQTLGLVEYTRAVDAQLEAQELRMAQIAAQAQLLDSAGQWKQTQGYHDQFRGLDVAPILSQLKADLAEISKLRQAASKTLAELQAQVQEREQLVAQVTKQLDEGAAALRELEGQSFKAGDDAAFAAYRERYTKLNTQVRELQEQQQRLKLGGRQGAELVGEDAASAELQGGTEVVGLEELQRRLTTAQERSKRLDSGNVSLEAHVKYLTESGQAASVETERFASDLNTLEAAQKTAVEKIKTLDADAFKKETDALQAAESAVRAFAAAARAASAWRQQLSEAQNQKDPNRRNERLAIILKDPYLENVAPAAEAAARVLVGRIQAQRVDATSALLTDMGRFGEINAKFEFDAGPFQERLTTARTAGVDALKDAVKKYESIAQKLAGKDTAWVPQGALAGVYQLLARLDPDQAVAYVGQANDILQKALDKREQFPYAAHLVDFRDHFAAAGETKSDKSSDKGGAKDEKGETFLKE
jgi:hypothetical protein